MIKNKNFIEVANINDLKYINEIEQNCFSDDFYSNNSIKENLTNANMVSFVYKVDGLAVGYEVASFFDDEAELLRIGVLPQFRNSGFASMLLQKLLEYFSNKSIKKIFLEVKESNIYAIKLYEKYGFRTINKRNKYYKDGENALIFELAI